MIYAQEYFHYNYPESNSCLIENNVYFDWVTNADTSILQISSFENFSSLIVDTTITGFSDLTVNITNSNQMYFWRVFNNESISKVDSFYLFDIYGYSLGLWLKNDSLLVVDSTNKILSWGDVSGNSYIFNQNDTLKSPQKKNNQLNGYSSLSFDGLNDFLIGQDILDIGKKSRTSFVVCKNSNVFPGYFYSKGDYASTNSYGLGFFGDGRLAHLYIDNSNKSAAKFFNNNNFTIYSTVLDRNNMMNQIRFNNLDSFSVFGIQDTSYLFDNSNSFYLGKASNFHLNGEIFEVIFFDEVLSNTEINYVHQYLRYKYTPPVNLGEDIYIPYGFCDTVIYAYKDWFLNYLWSDGSLLDSILIHKTGTYSINVTETFGNNSSDTIDVWYPGDFMIFKQDTITLCQGDTLDINIRLNHFGYDFLWSDNSSDSILRVAESGDYWVKVMDTLGCFQYSDTLTILLDSFSTQTSLGLDKIVCKYENLGLEIDNGGINYLWSTSDTSYQIKVDTSGLYWVQVRNILGCIAKDSINIIVNGIAPTVLFTTNGICENAPTTFNNNSFTSDGSNIIDWHWDFGDGDTSNIQSPQNKYDTAGVYNVVLQVLTDSGCVNSVQQQITIHKKPTAGFFPANGLICSNQNATFSNNSFSSDGIINSWDWDFGVTGLLDTSSLENGVYSFPNSGSFNVQLISLTEYGCSDTVSQFVNVKQTPTASFLIQDSCDNSPVGFINTSEGNLFSVFWDFGDFNSSTLNNPNHIYNTAGVYNTKLIVKDLNGCWDTLVSPITINENPEANFINDDYCVLSTIQLYDSSSTNSGFIDQWEWSILNTDYNSIIQNPQFLFNTSDTGVFNLKLKVANSFGCLDSVTKVISIYPLPVPEFTFSPQIGLPPLEVHFTNNSTGANTYEWDFGDNNISTSFDPVYTYTDSNIFDVKLTATSLYGCKDSVENTIQVINPIVDVAVRDVIYSLLPNSDLMRLTVQLDNVGVVSIQTLDLMLFNSSTGKVLEKWEGNILPNTQELVELSSIIEVPRGEIPDVICVEALMPNNSIDADDSNNEFCKSLLKFDLINIYPNPTINELNMELIFPESNQLEITLFNEIGKKVSMLYNGITEKGLNRYGFLLGSYSNGIYFVEIRFKDESIKKKIMIN
ncbi:PKD domain-containing protein [Vicingus serpentipes]|uniref:PKD domain-containing protein n=1 Tax=Vicingus serpentipes TaxID=1926625 RepID=UPI001477043D|nr:PKD domain-containing protein [Vicingus serpentipes]